MKIVYVGSKPMKADNVAKTGLTWNRGEIHEVADEKMAALLIEHSHVWKDADKPYEMEREISLAPEPPKPSVMIYPQGGGEVSAFWEPITIHVESDIFARLQNKELTAVFMSNQDADLFSHWKNTPTENVPEVDSTFAKEFVSKRKYNKST